MLRGVAIVLVLLTTTGSAVADRRACHEVYGEPTIGVGGTTRFTGPPQDPILTGGSIVLHRAALGYLRRPGCDETLGLRFGAALVFATGDAGASTPLGLGLEAEISTALRPGLSLGARLGIDHHSFLRDATSDGTTLMPMVGARLRIRDTVAVGMDAFYLRYSSQLWGRETGAGVMGTVSLDGRAGRIGAAVTSALLGFVFVLAYVRVTSDG